MYSRKNFEITLRQYGKDRSMKREVQFSSFFDVEHFKSSWHELKVINHDDGIVTRCLYSSPQIPLRRPRWLSFNNDQLLRVFEHIHDGHIIIISGHVFVIEHSRERRLVKITPYSIQHRTHQNTKTTQRLRKFNL